MGCNGGGLDLEEGMVNTGCVCVVVLSGAACSGFVERKSVVCCVGGGNRRFFWMYL